MRRALVALALIAATPVLAQIRAVPEAHILRNAPPGTEEEPTAVAPPVNLRPTQLLRCPDGKGGITLQDTPCKADSATAGAAAIATLPEVTDLSALPPRPKVEAPTPLAAEAPNRWVQGLLNGSWKLALLLAGCYALFRLFRYGRDRFQERFPPPEIPSRSPRTIR